MVESRNPVLRHAGTEYRQEGYAAHSGGPGQAPPPPSSGQLADMYHQPSLVRGASMTLTDVIMKSTLLFALLLVGAVVGWATAASMIWIAALIVGLVLGLVISFKRTVSPALVIIYALVEGVLVGGISAWYQVFGESTGFGNIVITAVIATFVVVAIMLALYATKIIKVTQRFQRILIGAILGYVVFGLISLVAALMGVGGGFGFFGLGWIGIALSIFVIGLAAFSLAMDFEMIRQYVAMGVPERESWRMAFGLMVTIIWLYLEILRLLAIIASGRD